MERGWVGEAKDCKGGKGVFEVARGALGGGLGGFTNRFILRRNFVWGVGEGGSGGREMEKKTTATRGEKDGGEGMWMKG